MCKFKRFECDVIDCDGYNDILYINAKNYKDCQKILSNSYHVQRINHVYCMDDYQ